MDYTGKVITKNPVTPTQVSAPGVWTLDEALQAQKGNNWPIPGVYNPISRSLRFNSADSAYLNWTPTFVGNRRTWTLSFWLKRTTLGTAVTETILATNDDNLASGNFDNIRLTTTGGITDKLEFYSYSTGYSIRLITTQVFRDPSAWYHFIIAVDTTQSTASNRVKIYLNGSQITAFTTETYPSQNYQTYINNAERQNLGVLRNVGSGLSQYLNGYMTEINFVDGQALTPSDFGLTDPATGVWVPKKYTGTYGTNGFYLNFKDNTTVSTLGNDYSGNGNNWNTNNFSVTAGAGNDSLTDVPTPWIGYSSGGDTGGVVRGNYCTLNPLKQTGATLTNGNLQFTKAAGSGSTLFTIHSTLFVSTGKWYFEVTPTSVAAGFDVIGVVGPEVALATYSSIGAMTGNIWGYRNDATKINNASSASYGNTWTSNDVIGVAIDMDNSKIWFSKNGTWQASGDPAAGTNAAYTNLTGSVAPLLIDQGSGTFDGSLNAGQRPFAYTPPAGYRSLCTTNLPTPAIGTSSTTQANDYFNAVLYNGTGATLGVTGVGFQPDFVWIKSRSAATDHALYDVVRGDKNQLESNTTTAETNETTGLTGFNADGFTVGSLAQVNTNTATYVSWNWKAGGNGVSNTAGSISSTVSANTDAGFSVVTYTGNATSGATVGHGLGVAPSMMILKIRGSTGDWPVYHTSIGNQRVLFLNLTLAQSGITSGPWNSTSPTSTVFTLGNAVETNPSNTMVAYCFAPVAGYSAFGSYTGNGSSDGPFVYLGFRPKWILIKPSDSADSWQIEDAARSPYNVVNDQLFPNSSQAEQVDSATRQTDFLSNGFKIRGTNSGVNGNAVNYIYAAFAESPFKFANAR